MQIGFEYLKRGDGTAALPWAQQAVAAAPNAFPAHKALGQALLETGDVEGAIRELTAGVKLAPESPGLHFQLARLTSGPGVPTTPRASATSSRGWIESRAPCAAPSRWGEDERDRLAW